MPSVFLGLKNICLDTKIMSVAQIGPILCTFEVYLAAILENVHNLHLRLQIKCHPSWGWSEGVNKDI